MAEDSKFNRDRLVKTLTSYIKKGQDGDSGDPLSARELIGAIAGWAGKGKDEVVQVLFREIGLATAAMLKEPLTQILENRKLQITLEFVPKNEAKAPTVGGKAPSRRSASAKKKKTRR